MNQDYDIGYIGQGDGQSSDGARVHMASNCRIVTCDKEGVTREIEPKSIKTLAVYADIPPEYGTDGKAYELFALEAGNGSMTDCMIREGCDDIFLDYFMLGNPDMAVLVVRGDVAKHYTARELTRLFAKAASNRKCS